MLNKIKENYQFTELEINQIDQIITNFQSSKISLEEFLDFFKIKTFYNSFYDGGNEICKELFNERESAIALVFDQFLKSFFEYDLLKKWEPMYEYVRFVFSRNRQYI